MLGNSANKHTAQQTITPPIYVLGGLCCCCMIGSFYTWFYHPYPKNIYFIFATIKTRFCSWIETDLQRTKLNIITYVSLIVSGPQQIKGRKTNGLVWAYFMPHQEELLEQIERH